MLSLKDIGCIVKELRRFSGSEQPWGGYHVLLAGDLYQLPPVGAPGGPSRYVWHSRPPDSASDMVRLGWESWRQINLFMELDETPRFIDPAYASLMGRVRTADVTSDDLIKINEHVVYAPNILDDADRDPNVLSIANRREVRHTRNARQLRGDDVVVITAHHSHRIATSNVPLDIPALMAVPASDNVSEPIVRLRLGAQVILRSNVAVDLGLANGTHGTLRQIIHHPNDSTTLNGRVPIAIVHFPSYHGTPYDANDPHLVPIGPVNSCMGIGPGRLAIRSQIPLEPSFVVTTHSAQGQTTASLTYHNDRGTRSYFTQSLHYVALSRNTSFDTLKLANTISMQEFQKFKPQLDAVTAEMNRLRTIPGRRSRHTPASAAPTTQPPSM